MTDEDIILRENGVQKARSLHRVAPEERFLRVEASRRRVETKKRRIVTQQDRPSGHRRVYLTTKVAAKHGAMLGCSGCVGLGPHTDVCRVRLEKALADGRADPVETPMPACYTNFTERADGFTDGVGTRRTQRTQRIAAKRDAEK